MSARDSPVWASARLIVDLYGIEAVEVARRAEELAAKGGAETAALWRAVSATVVEIVRNGPPLRKLH